jgi:AraC-like DNA-binding protein
MLLEAPQLSWFFLLLFAINGLTVILILILRNDIIRSTQFLLATNLLGITFGSIIICLVETKFILKVPFLFRLPSPVYYLMFPAAYLYVKLIVTDRVSLKKSDYLHFTPALVHLIEMTPFYLKSNPEKIAVINNIYNLDINMYAHNEGWLPPFIHNIIRGFIGIVYAIAMWRMLQKSKIIMSLSNKLYFNKILQWLKIFTIMNGMLGLIVIETLTFTFIPSEIRSLSVNLTFITILIISNYYLLFHPEILYGLSKLTLSTLSGLENIKVEVKKKKNDTILLNSSLVKNEIPEERIGPPLLNEYKIQVNDYIIQSAVYLNPDLSIFDLSRATTIPVHHLRLLINKNTGQRFNDFINEYRIQHMQTLINNGALLNKTLETLAFECGFSSKPAFIRGVKKLTNQTPGAYFKPKKSSASKGIP